MRVLNCLRAASPDDDEFMLAVYASTRAEELALVAWSAEQKDAFLRMQFDAQRHHYRLHYPAAEYSVILHDGAPAGRLIVDRSGDLLAVIDIALLPAYRGLGIGTRLLRALQDEAARADKAVRLRVEFFNPARRLYERLGFVMAGEIGIYQSLEWHAGTTA